MNVLVTVAVGSTILHEQALASPASACSRCTFLVDVAGAVVPLAITELIMSSATAIILAALALSGACVVNGARVEVLVLVVENETIVRSVVVTVDVTELLVVIVLIELGTFSERAKLNTSWVCTERPPWQVRCQAIRYRKLLPDQ